MKPRYYAQIYAWLEVLCLWFCRTKMAVFPIYLHVLNFHSNTVSYILLVLLLATRFITTVYAKVHWAWIPKSCLTVPILYLKCLPYDQLYFICLACAGWDTKQTSFENSNAAPEYAKKLECHASTLDSSVEPCLPKVCNFYVKNFVCSCRWGKLVNFSCDKYVCWKVGTLGFMWQIGVVTWKIVCVDNLYIKWQICL